jgi:3-isopropylmalate/(R)-2-methylmalate dehydratase small subunit
VPVHNGRAWAFTDNLRAHDVLPARFAAGSAADAAAGLFADLDATLAGQLLPGDVLVAGHNLGCGEGGAAAARALHAAAIGAVVAASFAPPFEDALLALDLPALAVDAPAIFHTGQRLRINFEGGTIANLSSGDRQPIRNLTDALLERLRSRFAP